MDKKTRIIELWKQTKTVHPTSAEIARIVGVNKSYAWRVIKDYLASNPNLDPSRLADK